MGDVRETTLVLQRLEARCLQGYPAQNFLFGQILPFLQVFEALDSSD